jgi:hypothetical protein
MARDQRHAFDQTVEAPDMAGVMCHQVDDHNGVDEVVVDEKAEVILNEGPLHMREVVCDHKPNGPLIRTISPETSDNPINK